ELRLATDLDELHVRRISAERDTARTIAIGRLRYEIDRGLPLCAELPGELFELRARGGGHAAGGVIAVLDALASDADAPVLHARKELVDRCQRASPVRGD